MILDIDMNSGVFTYRERPLSSFTDERIWKSWNNRFAGIEAGSLNRLGYRIIGVKGMRYMAHRLLWKVASGGDEPDELDHIDRNPSNNALANLRVATRSENNRNRSLSKYNTTGFCGVYASPRGRWIAQLKINGRPHHLGMFSTIDEAIAARAGADKLLSILGSA